MSNLSVELEAGDVGDRLDVVLARRVSGVSRRRAQYLIGAEIALVNGQASTKSTRLSAGDEVSLTERVGPDFVPAPRLLDEVRTVAANEWARILFKPRGVLCFGSDEADAPTVAGHLVALYPHSPEIGIEQRRAGIVSVLDASLGGLVIAAQAPRAFGVIRDHLFKGHAKAKITMLATGSDAAALEGDGWLRVARSEGGVLVLELALEPGPRPWPIRLTRPLLPQLRSLLAPHGLSIVGDDDSAHPAVHLGELAIHHRQFVIEGTEPLPADWPLPTG